MIPSLRNLFFEERLKGLVIFFVRHRRLRGDMVEELTREGNVEVRWREYFVQLLNGGVISEI